MTRTPVNYQNIFLEIDGGDCSYKIFEFFYKNNRLSESDRSTQLMRCIVKQLTDESTLSHTSSRGHRQRFSSSQTCDTPQPRFGTAQVIYSDFVYCSCTIMSTTTCRCSKNNLQRKCEVRFCYLGNVQNHVLSHKKQDLLLLKTSALYLKRIFFHVNYISLLNYFKIARRKKIFEF